MNNYYKSKFIKDFIKNNENYNSEMINSEIIKKINN